MLFNTNSKVVNLLLRFSPGHIQTLPSKYLWIWTAILYVCLQLEMLQEIPAMRYIIPLTRASLTYPICKQDVKRGMRRLRMIFSKPCGGWKLSLWLQKQNLHCSVVHPEIPQRGKISTYIHSSTNAARTEAEEAECISNQCETLRKGTCLHLCLHPEWGYWLKQRGVGLLGTGSFFFHSGIDSPS